MSDTAPFQFKKQFEVLSFQIDTQGKLRLSALADLMQETAWKHADSKDFGQILFEKGLVWVLSRMQIKVTKMPSWGDQITVKTAGRGINKIFALREFLVVDNKGEILAAAQTAWILLDINSKRPQRPNQVLPAELFALVNDDEQLPEKLNSPQNFDLDIELTVRPFDLDMNNHVNNVSYIRWVEDFCICEEIAFSELLINYTSEAKLHDKIELSSLSVEKGLLLEGKSNDKSIFIALVS